MSRPTRLILRSCGVSRTVALNLNKLIDINYYPCPEQEKSASKHRPIGIGAQGLADVFILLRLPYDSDEAQRLNTRIFETISYGALEGSCDAAEKSGPYSSYEGSPISKGKEIITIFMGHLLHVLEPILRSFSTLNLVSPPHSFCFCKCSL